jgi:phage terminase large subunit-like protein
LLVRSNAADRVRHFCAHFLRHSKGQFAGKPFEFLDYQWSYIIAPLFGWKRADGRRRFRRSFVLQAKKNGKSTLLAALGLYLLCKDDEAGAEVYTAAADREQASIIYNESANMVDASPALKSRLKVRRSRKAIEYKATRSSYRALSADANTKEGFNIHALLFDELHAQPGRALWDALKYGGAGRRQPIYMAITTAGEWDEESLWWEQWKYAEGILNGSVIDPSYHAACWNAHPADDWTKEETWKKANPSYGVTIDPVEMAEECDAAQRNPAAKSSFLRYRLNVPTKAETEWLAIEAWNACAEKFTLRDLAGATCYGGLDLASTNDIIAYVEVFRKEDLIYLIPHFWVPQREVENRDKGNKQKYDKWVESGHLAVTSTEPVADYNVIRRDVIKRCRRVPTDKVLIDRWNATQLAYNLQKSLRRSELTTKLQFATFNTRTVSAATKEMERLILSTRLRHPANPVLDWMFGNVIVRQDALGNRMPDRSASKDKIDGIAAAVLALAVMIEEQRAASKYEKQGLHNADD